MPSESQDGGRPLERTGASTTRLDVLGIVACFCASLTNSGCGHSCTARGCATSTAVVFSRALDPSKSYAVTVVADGSTTKCTVTQGSADPCAIQTVWTGGEKTVTATGVAYPLNGFAGLAVTGQVTELSVTILQADQVVASGQFSKVSYTGIEENGPGCGTCQEASVALSVP